MECLCSSFVSVSADLSRFHHLLHRNLEEQSTMCGYSSLIV